jgi:hypothetical protein
VVDGGMRHAEPQREMFPRSYGVCGVFHESGHSSRGLGRLKV